MQKKLFVTLVATVLLLGVIGTAQTNSVAEVMVGSSGINWQPRFSYERMILSVSCPDGSIINKTFQSGTTPYFELSELGNSSMPNGAYTYELRLIPRMSKKNRMTQKSENRILSKPMVQNGYFTVQGGSIMTPSIPEANISKPMDALHYDDVIITGSLCVGFDCINGESFGYCTAKLKENNLQLCFEDTSAGSFPTNDWKIQINDTTSGGGSYFTIWDTDGGRRPFTIEAGAPAHSLYVEDYGRIGLGTSIPYVELHIVDGDSPTVRLDQDGSSGWAAQSWDLCGNETNFFLRDVTNGSKLCFRVQPNTPSSTLCLKSTGFVGIGTWSPEATLEVETTGTAAKIWVDRTDGATAEFLAKSTAVSFGSKTAHEVQITSNSSTKMVIQADGDVGIGNTAPGYLLTVGNSGAYCDGGAWVPGSSREFKENIHNLTLNDAENALENLNPVRFNYKTGKQEEYLGFISEDVPDLVATFNRKGVVPMDVVAVLTKVLQEQQKTIQELKEKVEKLEKK